MADPLIERAAWGACLILPLALLHARAVAEILIATIDLLFVVRCWALRDATIMRRPFTRAACVWWVWLVACSLPHPGSLGQAVLALRLPVLAVAAGDWLLLRPERKRALWWATAASLAWIGLECWQQYLSGKNLFGQARWGDGALTGPFNKPRAGPAFILLFFPVIVPASMALFAGRAWHKPAGAAVLAGAVLTMLLIGQRMPSVLMLLGLGMAAVLVPGLRRPVLGAALAGAVLIASLPVLSPTTYDKLVVQSSRQLHHFGDSDYGLIFSRAVMVARQHPWLGLGFDGFRRSCAPILSREWSPTEQLTPRVRECNIHPHNYYLEAADNAGVPGLIAFCLMVGLALAPLARGLWRRTDPVRVGLLTGALVAFWPVASTSAFTSMPNAGWVFLVLGAGFAASPTTAWTSDSTLEKPGERRLPLSV